MKMAIDSYESERYEPMQDSFNTIQMRLDPTPALETIRRHLLRKTIYNSSKGVWERPKGAEPMFDTEGINELMAVLYARIGVDTVLSMLKNDKINQIVRECGEDIIEFIFFKEDIYNIQESDHNNILHTITHKIDIFLRRATATTSGGTENALLTKGLSMREVTTKRETPIQDNTDYSPNPGKGFNFFGR
jgi:hypothetical protein